MIPYNQKNTFSCDCIVLPLILLPVHQLNNDFSIQEPCPMMINQASGNEAGIRLELGTHAAVSSIWRRMADDMTIIGFV